MALTSEPDFGRTVVDYTRHRAGFPPETLDRLASHGVGLPGQRVLDLGTGTGTLARQFALRGCDVTGLDPSSSMLEAAARLDSESRTRVDYRLGTAERTGFPDASFDVVTAGQCWHWFDRPAAAQEALRVLRPEGRVAIVHFDWLPLPGNAVAATEQLILEFNPTWQLGSGTGVYPQWLRDLGDASFEGIETFSFDVAVPYTVESWVGRVRASAGVAAVLSEPQVEAFTVRLTDLLNSRDEPDPLLLPHRVWGVVARSPHERVAR